MWAAGAPGGRCQAAANGDVCCAWHVGQGTGLWYMTVTCIVCGWPSPAVLTGKRPVVLLLLMQLL